MAVPDLVVDRLEVALGSLEAEAALVFLQGNLEGLLFGGEGFALRQRALLEGRSVGDLGVLGVRQGGGVLLVGAGVSAVRRREGVEGVLETGRFLKGELAKRVQVITCLDCISWKGRFS